MTKNCTYASGFFSSMEPVLAHEQQVKTILDLVPISFELLGTFKISKVS